jgi:hypothetical protein
VGLAQSDNEGDTNIDAGTGPFAGRMILSNFICDDNNAGLKIASNDVNDNSLMIYPGKYGAPPSITESKFYGGAAFTCTNLGSVASYPQAGPIYFEAPGTGGGDWALGYDWSATELKTRNGFGGAGETINFPLFNGGSGNSVLLTWCMLHTSGHAYSFNYRIYKFETF